MNENAAGAAPSLFDIATFTNSLALLWAFLALFGLVWFTRWLDKRSGFRFRDTITIIRQSPVAAGIYYGQRFLGAALVVAAALS